MDITVQLSAQESAKALTEADASVEDAASSITAVTNPWKSKKTVLAEAMRKVDRIRAFRQAEFDQKRA